MLNSIGVTANVQSDYQEQEITVPTYKEEITSIDYERISYTYHDGHMEISGEEIVPQYTKASVPQEPLKTTGFVEVASIAMEDNNGNPTPPVFSGRRAPSGWPERSWE